MKNYLKISCIILFAAVLSAQGANSRSSSNSTKSAAQKLQEYNSQRITELLELYKKNPKNVILNNRLGYLYYTIGKYKNSEYHYKQAILYNPKNIEARLGLYLISSANKDYIQAAAYCREVKSIDNLNYYGNLYFVYAKMAQYQYKSAETVCRKMLTVYPSDITFLRLLKLNYTYQKQPLKARQIQENIDILK